MTIWYGWRAGDAAQLPALTKEEEELLASRRHGDALTESRIAQSLMKEAAASLGQENCVIRRSETGAPVTDAGLFVSCSHTRSFICGAASYDPVGIDAQPLETVHWGAARRCFTPQEQEALSRLSGEEADLWFTRLWTLKEAYGKMTGLGLIGAKGVSFTQNEDQVLCSDPSVETSLCRDGDVLISLVMKKR